MFKCSFVNAVAKFQDFGKGLECNSVVTSLQLQGFRILDELQCVTKFLELPYLRSRMYRVFLDVTESYDSYSYKDSRLQRLA